tara:strand:+ start:25042 stop:25365 length:324 start_codon:yes stop_codon:yes gene_type:complete
MRKLFELFLSFFRPVPKDVVNTGHMTEDQLWDYRHENGLCTWCGSSEDVAPEGTHCDADGICFKCFMKAEFEEAERDLRQMIEREEDCSRRLVLIGEYEDEFGTYNG